MRRVIAGIGLGIAIVACGVATVAQAPTATPPAAVPGPAPVTPAPATCGPNATPAPAMKNVARDSRCFELRTYVVQPEGPGDADTLHRRFREHTVTYFKKHGMAIVGFWQPVNKPDTIVYLLAYKDAAARDAAWKAFNADAEWLKARASLFVRIQSTSEFVVATDYSPLK